MNVTGIFSVWAVNERENNGRTRLSVQVSDSRKDQNGAWVQDNSFWAEVAGDAAAYIRSIRAQIPARGAKGVRPPHVRFSGVERGRGMKAKDGSTYEAGFITFFQAEDPSAGRDSSPAPAAAASTNNANNGFVSVPDVDEELPFM